MGDACARCKGKGCKRCDWTGHRLPKPIDAAYPVARR